MIKTRVLLAASVMILALASRKSKLPLKEIVPPSPLSFTIVSHGVNFTSADANKVLEQEQRILTKRSIMVPLQLNGDVTIAGAITTCDDIKALMKPQPDNNHEIHVVKSIPCCGPPTNATIVGCSGTKMPLIVTMDEATDQGTLRLRAVQWLHELGHHRGLCHSIGISALMSGAPLTVGNTRIDQCVQAAFTGDPIDPSCTQSCSGLQQSGVSDFGPGH
jgi:hypothetical protein